MCFFSEKLHKLHIALFSEKICLQEQIARQLSTLNKLRTSKGWQCCSQAGSMKNLVLKIIRGSYPPVHSRYSYDLRFTLSITAKTTSPNSLSGIWSLLCWSENQRTAPAWTRSWDAATSRRFPPGWLMDLPVPFYRIPRNRREEDVLRTKLELWHQLKKQGGKSGRMEQTGKNQETKVRLK